MPQNPPFSEAGDEGPRTDLEQLDAYLSSERSPPRCMDLSELDGFMAGILAGPETIPASEWIPVIWDGDEAAFESEEEAEQILATIMNRYGEIEVALDGDPADFMPVFWEDDDGEPIVSDWAHGFMHAVSLRTDAWDPVLQDEETALLLIPIGLIAGQAVPDIDEVFKLPDEEMEDLLEDADEMLIACAIGLRTFWRDRQSTTPVRH